MTESSSKWLTAADPRPNSAVRLLLSCCAGIVSGGNEEAQRLAAAPGLDWCAVPRLARYHQVSPLVLQALRALGSSEVPAAVIDTLETNAGRAAQRSLYLTAQLQAVLGHLDDRGISAIALKGPALSQRLYGHIAAREYYDTDVLIPRRHVLDLKAYLLSSGYEREYRMGPVREALHLLLHCEYNFRRPDALPLEIHWRLFPADTRFSLPTDALWERAEQIRLGGHSVAVLSAEDELLVQCLHNGGKHRWQFLRWVCDVAMLVQRYGERLRWDDLLARATACGCRRALATGLAVGGLLGARPPQCVSDALDNDAVAASLTASFVHGLLSDPPPPQHGLRTVSTYLRLRERWIDRAAYVPTVLAKLVRPSPRDRTLMALPRMLSFLYLLARPLRLIVKYLRMSAGREEKTQ